MELVKIGEQIWMSDNLNIGYFRNGEIIPHAKTDNEWFIAGKKRSPAWCYLNNDPENEAKYGKLYNWYAVNDPRGLAPRGWYVPTDGDWTKLTVFIGEDDADIKLKSSWGWPMDNNNGTDEYGFSALPGSTRHLNGSFNEDCDEGFWWSSSENKIEDLAWRRSILFFSGMDLVRDSNTKESGCSVRCIRYTE